MDFDMRRREGFSLKVYADSKGLATQGIGRHHGVKFGDSDITEATAVQWLADDLQQAYQDARSLVHDLDSLDVVRRESIIDCSFNMGINSFEMFVPFLNAVNRHDWPSAHLHLLTNLKRHLTPYLTDTGVRAVDNAGRIATGFIPAEFIAP